MKKWKWKPFCAVGLGILLAVQAPSASLAPVLESHAYTERSASTKATTLNVRSDAGTSSSIVAKLSYGTAVTVINEKKAANGDLWYQIRFTGSGGTQNTGWVLNTYIKFPVSYSSDADFEAYLKQQGFPESYKPGLRELHTQYPNWVFTAQNTGLDWNTVIQNEAVIPLNLVYTNSISSWKSTASGAYNWDNSTWPGFDGSNWVAASEDIIRYYMDPRNFLNETYVFQFLTQSYDGAVQNKEGLQTMVKNTFLSGSASVSGDYGSSGSGSPGSGPSSGTGNSGGTTSKGPGGSKDEGYVNSGPGAAPGFSGGSGSGSQNGNSGSSQGNNSQDSNGQTSSGGVGYQAPSSKGNPGVTFKGPQASVSPKERNFLTTSAGPGAELIGPGSSGNGGSQQGAAPVYSGGNINYADIIMEAGKQSGVNPYVLAAMIIQEQGSNGSTMISGTVSGYEGYYNFFNIGAYESGSMSATKMGLQYASQSGSYNRPWNSIDRAILGGAIYYGSNYVKAGQDTFYLKKFNVQGSNLYKHQYMSNVQAAAEEGAKMSNAYNAEMKKTALEFKIPIYKNMPEQASAKPAGDGSPNNKLGSIGVDGFYLTPTFNRDTESYDLIVHSSVTSIQVSAQTLDSKASVSGTGTVQLQNTNNEVKLYVKAQNGAVREYTLHVVRSDSGPVPDSSIQPSSQNPSGQSPSGQSPSGNNGGGQDPGSIGPGANVSNSSNTTIVPGSGNVIVVNP